MKEKNSIKQRVLRGRVLSDDMQKTIVVKIDRTYVHPLLDKVMHVSKKYKVHDEHEDAAVGDLVEIYEGRPVSKTKYMYLARILESTKEAV